MITQATAEALYDALYELVAAAQEGYDTCLDRDKNDRAINREIDATKVAIDVLHQAAKERDAPAAQCNQVAGELA